jgi:hypothetical protein
LWNSGTSAFEFDGNPPVRTRVFGGVDFAKSAGTNSTPDAIMAAKDKVHLRNVRGK